MRRWLALALILAAAAVLRFTGLSWGLRHPPHVDEHYFVQYTAWMVAAGDVNHRFHEYPGLLFYLLAPFVAPFGAGAGPAAYLAARALIAAFGTASVLLAWRLGTDLVGARGGLFAAALVAVSPLEVRTAHMVRPDVALATLALAALIVFRGVGPRPRGDAVAGAAVGAATALKFSGALLAVPYLARRLSQTGGRWWSPLLAGAAALAAFALLSPATFLHGEDALAGAAFQARYHYESEEQPDQSYPQQLANYVSGIAVALGAPGALLAVLGFAAGRRQWREWLPLAALPVAIVAVFATADVRHLRHLLPALGGLAVAAARGLEAVPGRGLRLAAAAVALGVPLHASASYVGRIVQPGARDQAADWIEAHLPDGARVLTTFGAEVGLDPARYEVVRMERLDAGTLRLALHFDLVAAGATDDRGTVHALERRAVFAPGHRDLGSRIVLLGVPDARRPRYAPVALDDARITAQPADGPLAAVHDGDAATAWSMPASPGDRWIEVAWPAPRRVGRIEVAVPADDPGGGGNLHVHVPQGRGWRRLAVAHGRPPVPEQHGARSQSLILEPVATDRLRLVQKAPVNWHVAELRLDALP
jgi:hypothetical protein